MTHPQAEIIAAAIPLRTFVVVDPETRGLYSTTIYVVDADAAEYALSQNGLRRDTPAFNAAMDILSSRCDAINSKARC